MRTRQRERERLVGLRLSGSSNASKEPCRLTSRYPLSCEFCNPSKRCFNSAERPASLSDTDSIHGFILATANFRIFDSGDLKNPGPGISSRILPKHRKISGLRFHSRRRSLSRILGAASAKERKVKRCSPPDYLSTEQTVARCCVVSCIEV